MQLLESFSSEFQGQLTQLLHPNGIFTMKQTHSIDPAFIQQFLL